MDAGIDTFALHIPSRFQRDLLAGHDVTVQLNVDATRMSQAFTGSSYILTIVTREVNNFLHEQRPQTAHPVEQVLRARFNPELNKVYFGAVMELVSAITMLAVVLTGAALIREREHGTVEHLLVMPVTPFQIMSAKIWAMGLVVLMVSAVSLYVIVRGLLAVPIEGSIALFFAGTLLHLFATTSMGIFLGTIARSMPQFGLLLFMVLLPKVLSGAGGIIRAQTLSGGAPREGMPDVIQLVMQAAPTTHFVNFAQAILFRSADSAVVWSQFAALAMMIGLVLFSLFLARFRKTIHRMECIA